MELKIKISDEIYEEIKNDNSISFSELHELFDAIRNGTPADGWVPTKKIEDQLKEASWNDFLNLCSTATEDMEEKKVANDNEPITGYKELDDALNSIPSDELDKMLKAESERKKGSSNHELSRVNACKSVFKYAHLGSCIMTGLDAKK